MRWSLERTIKMNEKNKHQCICNQSSWDVVAAIFGIMTMSVIVSIWQNNPHYLWLNAMSLLLSTNKCKIHPKEDN